MNYWENNKKKKCWSITKLLKLYLPWKRNATNNNGSRKLEKDTEYKCVTIFMEIKWYKR